MIRIDEGALLRAGFPRDLVAALRDLATLSASSVTTADLNALQIQITANDAELAALEGQALMRHGLTEVRQKMVDIEHQIAAVKRPAVALPIPVAGGGSGNSVMVTCDFGASFTDKAQTVVTGESWITGSTVLNAEVLTASGTDPDEMYLLGIRAVVSDIVPGDGFTVTLYSEAEARGIYTVMVSGI